MTAYEKRAAAILMTNRPHISNQPRFNAANVDSSQESAQSFAALPHRVVKSVESLYSVTTGVTSWFFCACMIATYRRVLAEIKQGLRLNTASRSIAVRRARYLRGIKSKTIGGSL